MDANIIDIINNSKNKKIKIAVTDVDGILRGKYLNKDKFNQILKKGLGFCSVIFGWDSADVLYNNIKHTGWHTGYHDDQAIIDVKSFRQVSWDDDVPLFLADFSKNNHPACPRALLKKVITKSENMGYKPLFSQEFEWFNFRETSESIADKGYINPKHISSGMFGYSLIRLNQNKAYINDIYDSLIDFKINIEGLHTETGPGVLEAAIAYTNILEAADQATLFKLAVKEIARNHCIIPSFMAKISPELPGCSGHIHQSLTDGKENLFYSKKDKNKMSELMKNYIAGQLKLLPYLLPMIAPTINSYKRLVEGMWAPVRVNWAIDNRTTMMRVINNSSQSSRVELRAPGSDTNPYLAMAASLASGLYGIENKLSLDKIPQIVGNGYDDKENVKISDNLWDATQKMKNSQEVKMIFGDKFVDHFCSTREWEWKQHLKAVTDWEYKRYFEII